MNLKFWLKWSWRDLRARWLQVIAISIIIALGTSVYASMGGSSVWRIDAYDLGYGRLNMYDLHIDMAEGSYVDDAALREALADIDGVAVMETRLISPILVDASHGETVIMVKGEIVGVNVADGGPHVNGIHVDDESGRTLTDADAGQDVVIVEYKFAQAHGLKPGSPIRVSGGVELDFVGAGHSPEYFMVMGEIGDYFGQANYAVLFASLETAQRLTEREGMVNDVVMLLEEGADREAVREVVRSRMQAAFPDVGITLGFTEDDPMYTMLYKDAKGDQVIWDTVSFMFLLGAAIGSFSLSSRMVESQRREIGIGMAMGITRRWLAFRPLLVGLQIAVLGTVLGVLLGIVLLDAFAGIFKAVAPLPFWDIKLYKPALVTAIALGIFMPLIAVVIPVWRAVRVQPIDAIKSGYLVAKGGGLSKLAQWLPLPGRSFTHMPIKNVLRSPWRAFFTIVGVAIAIMLMVTMLGAMDSYISTMGKADDAYRYMAEDRYNVILRFPMPVGNGEVRGIETMTRENGEPLFTALETSLMLPGHIWSETNPERVEIALEFHDMSDAIWVPRLLEGELVSDEPGVVIAKKAADDLNVGVGDTITLEHLSRAGLLRFAYTETPVKVIGIHDNPFRPFVYMDMSHAALTGFQGLTNYLALSPAEGVTKTEVKLAMLEQDGVASVKSVSDFSESVESLLELVTGMLAIVQVVAVLMAFLIAFLSTSISVDERMREIATMFAFGLRIRTVTRMQMLENCIIGVFGTFLGIVVGWAALSHMFIRAQDQIPEIGLTILIAPETILIAAALGVLVVTLTPILSVRRMRNMDIPSTLRVME